MDKLDIYTQDKIYKMAWEPEHKKRFENVLMELIYRRCTPKHDNVVLGTYSMRYSVLDRDVNHSECKIIDIPPHSMCIMGNGNEFNMLKKYSNCNNPMTENIHFNFNTSDYHIYWMLNSFKDCYYRIVPLKM